MIYLDDALLFHLTDVPGAVAQFLQDLFRVLSQQGRGPLYLTGLFILPAGFPTHYIFSKV